MPSSKRIRVRDFLSSFPLTALEQTQARGPRKRVPSSLSSASADTWQKSQRSRLRGNLAVQRVGTRQLFDV
jgi:hypothetical protein